jgi:hypothetical protein
MLASPPSLDRRTGTAVRPSVKSLGQHDYGCLLAPVPQPLCKAITDWVTEKIPDCFLSPTGEGRELRPHVTVKYGFTGRSEDVLPSLEAMLTRNGPINARLIGMALFPDNGEGDVLHMVVYSPELVRLNRSISQSFPCKDVHPRYIPHVTLAYLDPGVSQSCLRETPPFLGSWFVVDTLEWSGRDGESKTIPLSFAGWGFKTLSWQGEDSGGALAPPPKQKKAIPLQTNDDPLGTPETKTPEKKPPKEKPKVEKKQPQQMTAAEMRLPIDDVVPPNDPREVAKVQRFLLKKQPKELETAKEIPTREVKPPRGVEELDTPRMRILGHIFDTGKDVDFTKPENRDYRKIQGLEKLAEELGMSEEDAVREFGQLGDDPKALKQSVAKRQRLQVAKSLYEQPIKKERPMPGGVMNDTTFVLFENGSAGIYKPAKHERGSVKFGHVPGTGYLREVVAYQIAEILKMDDLVPVTIIRDAHKGVGSVMQYIQGKMPEQMRNPYDGKKDAARAALFDYLLGQQDRNDMNWIFLGDKLKMIDNASCLPSKYIKDGFIWMLMEQFAAQQGLDMPDETDSLLSVWDDVESVMEDGGIEREAIVLTQQRFEEAGSGRYNKIADLPAYWANPNEYGYDDTLGELMGDWK